MSPANLTVGKEKRKTINAVNDVYIEADYKTKIATRCVLCADNLGYDWERYLRSGNYCANCNGAAGNNGGKNSDKELWKSKTDSISQRRRQNIALYGKSL